MKICVLGSSHCGALYHAWQNFRPKGKHSLSFFALPSPLVKNFVVVGKTITVTQPEARQFFDRVKCNLNPILDPDDYDRFILYGTNHPVDSQDTDINHSQALRAESLKDRFEASKAHELTKRLRSITSKPIDVMPSPYMCAPQFVAPLVWKTPLAEENEFFRKKFNRYDARYLPQPAETIVPGNTRATLRSYLKGDRTKLISTTDAHNDRQHMGHVFAEVQLRHYYTLLDG